jgi:virginiamycin B lyase
MNAQPEARRWLLTLVMAACITVAGGPARGQIIDSVVTDTPNSGPGQTVTAPDGTVWFVEEKGNRIGAINPTRTDIVEFSLRIANSQPTALTVDGLGRVWFTEAGTNRIGVYTPASNYLVEYYWGGANLGLAGISVDNRGRIFFTENRTNRIGLLDPGRLTLQYYSWTTQDVGPLGIACDSFGRAWFTENRANRIGVVDPTWGYVYDYYYAGQVSAPYGIVVDYDNDIWFTEQAAGAISLLDSSTGAMFQFDAFGGSGAQPKYIDTWQTNQNQTIVAWTEAAAGSGRVGLLNADTGAKSQIQASSPFAAPTGVTFAPDNSLWWTEYNSSQIRGWYYTSSIVRRGPAVGAPLLAMLPPSAAMPERSRPVLAAASAADDSQILLVKKENKGKHGRKKQTKIDKKQAKIDQIARITTEEHRPEKKARKINKQRAG